MYTGSVKQKYTASSHATCAVPHASEPLVLSAYVHGVMRRNKSVCLKGTHNSKLRMVRAAYLKWLDIIAPMTAISEKAHH
jgi:hypothetical protein